jgi:predicted transcriptional regulator
MAINQRVLQMKSRSNETTVRALISNLGLSMRQASNILGITERHLYRVLNGQYKSTDWDEIKKKLK